MLWVKVLARFLAAFAIMAATASGAERLARSLDEGMVGRSRYEGAPFAHHVHHFDSSEDGSSNEEHDRAALAINLGLFALIALVSAIRWSRGMRPRDPSQPVRLPLGAEPLPPDATIRNNPRLRRMAIYGVAWLVVTVAGAFTGAGLVFGAAGWLAGGRLRGQYEMLGREPHEMAVAAWAIGPGMVLTSVLVGLGVVLHWGVV